MKQGVAQGPEDRLLNISPARKGWVAAPMNRERQRTKELPLAPDPSRPGGPPAKHQPSPEGLGLASIMMLACPGVPWERRRRGTPYGRIQ
jgi:hypothetical protein